MIARLPRFRPSTLAVLLLMPGTPSRCTTLLTVHNRTGKILMVSPPGSPWHAEPDDPPGLAASRRWLGPGSVGTYRFTSPGKVVETDVVIRSLHLDGRVECEGFMIQAVDPDLDPPCPQNVKFTPKGRQWMFENACRGWLDSILDREALISRLSPAVALPLPLSF